MGKKLKDWYDLKYVEFLSNALIKVYPTFDKARFFDLVKKDLLSLEFIERQTLLARALNEVFELEYEPIIEVFSAILGPELMDNYGNFSEGYWLWPLSRFVELFGVENLDVSLRFSKELTKRFTAEYCMRPLIMKHPDYVLNRLLKWSKDEHVRVRRLASECLRIRLPWAKKMTVALDYFTVYQEILTNLKDDADIHIKKSVGNNLNDLYKEDSQRFYELIHGWGTDLSVHAQWIIKHGSRNIK